MTLPTAPAGALPAPDEADVAEHVVVVGVAGLRWSDVDPAATPQLAAIARTGSVGTLSVRSAPSVTCPAEGWLTLGAGTYAAVSDPGRIDPEDGCAARPLPAVVAGTPTRVPALEEIDRLNRDLRFGARVGWLSRRPGCVAAIGSGAALATADAAGLVSHYTPTLPDPVADSFTRCPATLIDAGSLPDETAAARTTALRQLDTTVGRIRATLPPQSVLMVLGIAETASSRPHLHAVMAEGPGFAGGYLRSGSTRRLPYVQLVDVAPTILRSLGYDVADTLAGRPVIGGRGDRPASLDETLRRLTDTDRRAVQQRRVLPTVWVGLATALVLLATALAGLLARRRRGAPVPTPALTALRTAALAMSAVPAATFLANLVPWWRASRPTVAVLGAVLAGALVILAVALAAGRRLPRLAPSVRPEHAQIATVAGAGLAMFFADGLSGAGLQIDSLLGYNALHAGRFVGFGNIAFSVLGAGAVTVASLLTAGRGRAAASALLAAVALPVLALDGSPRWGADFGGVLTLVPTFGVLALLVTGTRVTWRRLAIAQAGGVAVVGLLGWLDYLRPADERSHFGRFVGTVLDGTAYHTIERKLLTSWELLFVGPHTLAALALTVLLVVVVFRPPPVLADAYAAHAMLRPMLQATVALALLGAATNDSGIAVPAVVALVTVPVTLVLCAATGEPPGCRRPSEAA